MRIMENELLVEQIREAIGITAIIPNNFHNILMEKCPGGMKQLEENLQGTCRNWIKKFYKAKEMNYFDVTYNWDNFRMQRLPKLIMNFNPARGAKFTTFIYREIIYQCIQDIKKNPRQTDTPKTKEDMHVPDESEIAHAQKIAVGAYTIYISDEARNNSLTRLFSGENKQSRLVFYSALFAIINNIDTPAPNILERILVYHCRVILPLITTIHDFRDTNYLLMELQNEFNNIVSNRIELEYNESLMPGNYEKFMEILSQRLIKAGNEAAFLENMDFDNKYDADRLTQWVRQIKDILNNRVNRKTICAIQKTFFDALYTD